MPRKFKSAVKVHDRINDISELVEMITGDIIDSKELSHMWDEGLEIINIKLDLIEQRLAMLEQDAYGKGFTDLEYKIKKIIEQHEFKGIHTRTGKE